jgi:predicted GNAT family acetyltransferase
MPSTPRLTIVDDAAAFRDLIEPFLLRQEAVNCVILGLINTLIDTPDRYLRPPLLAAVESDGAVVAAFLMTPPHRLNISTSDHPAVMEVAATALYEAGWTLPGVNGPAVLAETFARHWLALSGRDWTQLLALRIFEARQVTPPPDVSGNLRRATRDDRDLLIDWFTAFAADTGLNEERSQLIRSIDHRLENPHGGIWFWEVAGTPVSLVAAASPTPHGIRIGPVYTPPEHRRFGYASAATAAVSQLQFDAGHEFVFLFTDLANATANHIYQAIGYRPVCDTTAIAFESAMKTA